MNTDKATSTWTEITLATLGFLAVVLVLAFFGGYDLPVIADAHNALIILGIVGLLMCAIGGIRSTIRAHGWKSLEVAIGSGLGIISLILVGSALFGFEVPYIHDSQTALVVLCILMMAKIVIANLPADTDPSA